MAGTLIARDLHKAHGAATILAGVSLTVAPGDVLGVVGPNGRESPRSCVSSPGWSDPTAGPCS
jgi:ABC-type histidine transport system ATPase subunit